MVDKMYHNNRISVRDKKTFLKAMLIMEKKKIMEHYDFINCRLLNDKTFECIGKIKPTEQSIEYTFKIIYDLKLPKVYILDPIIEYSNEIHLYPQDNSLCLYHPKRDNLYWDFRKHHIYDTIIPWTIEWFTFYELYQITGKWEHPEIKHIIEKN